MQFFHRKQKTLLFLSIFFLINPVANSMAEVRRYENKYEDIVSAKKFVWALVLNLMILNDRSEYEAKIIQYKNHMTKEACRNHIMFLKNYNLYDQLDERKFPMSAALWDARIGLDGFEKIMLIEEDKNDHGLQHFQFKVPLQVTFNQGWKDVTYNVITSVHVTQKEAGKFKWVLSDWDQITDTRRTSSRRAMDYNTNRANKEDIMCKQNLIEKNTLSYFKYK